MLSFNVLLLFSIVCVCVKKFIISLVSNNIISVQQSVAKIFNNFLYVCIGSWKLLDLFADENCWSQTRRFNKYSYHCKFGALLQKTKNTNENYFWRLSTHQTNELKSVYRYLQWNVNRLLFADFLESNSTIIEIITTIIIIIINKIGIA